MYKKLPFLFLFASSITALAQPERWQQRVKYTIDASLNVQTNIVSGKENIIYWNNSPDTLHRIFIHLYWNAFQPGSMMDVRSRELGKILLGYTKQGEAVYDWDDRVKDRILNLKPDEQGYNHIKNILVNSRKATSVEHGTILEVDLDKVILPHSQNTISLQFEAQVPVQIRRSGRDNKEGVLYSMSQWYPKIAEYDYEGWNANPYIAREFYGVWGDFDVYITIDKHYLLAGTGTIQNPDVVGFGYGTVRGIPKTPAATATWHFMAHDVHDFVWAADTAYVLLKRKIPDGPLFYFVYKKKDSVQDKQWNATADTVAYAYKNFIAKTFGQYPYKNYSFIQGGDGGMEYPMATLIKSGSLGTALHEFGHSWYQGVLGSNESLFPWMDEGGATYFETRTTGWLHGDSLWYLKSLDSYFRLVESRREEPMSTHADHYNTNMAYELAAYGKGATFYEQLSYIIGNKNMDRFLLNYYHIWQFRHPNANDLIRIAEKTSGLELEWYKQYWIYSTKTIDYGIKDLADINNHAVITLQRIGKMPMPLDIMVTYKDGAKEMYNIPCNMMYGHKPAENNYYPWNFTKEWYWTSPEYELQLAQPISAIQSVEIDPSRRMADVDRSNNIWKNQ